MTRDLREIPFPFPSSGTSTQQAGGIDVNMKRDSSRKDVNMERPANG